MKIEYVWELSQTITAPPSQALDFIIYAARMHDLRMILALGNFWDAYSRPEDFLYWAYPRGGLH